MSLTERGEARVQHQGIWEIGPKAQLAGSNQNASDDDRGSLHFVNQPGGILTCAEESAHWSYVNNTEKFLNKTILIENHGILAPGLDRNGAARLELVDMDLAFTGEEAALRLNIADTRAGEHDALKLTRGRLTFKENSRLEIYYRSAFDPEADFDLPILFYEERIGEIKFPANFRIFNTAGSAADPARYRILWGPKHSILPYRVNP